MLTRHFRFQASENHIEGDAAITGWANVVSCENHVKLVKIPTERSDLQAIDNVVEGDSKLTGILNGVSIFGR